MSSVLVSIKICCEYTIQANIKNIEKKKKKMIEIVVCHILTNVICNIFKDNICIFKTLKVTSLTLSHSFSLALYLRNNNSFRFMENGNITWC